MNLNRYQREARSTAIYPENANIIYPALGLAGEAGEVCEKIKKVLRDSDGVFNENQKLKIVYELGDVLWYIANLADDLGYPLDQVAELNLAKLKSRQDRDQLQGSGDER